MDDQPPPYTDYTSHCFMKLYFNEATQQYEWVYDFELDPSGGWKNETAQVWTMKDTDGRIHVSAVGELPPIQKETPRYDAWVTRPVLERLAILIEELEN